MSQTTRNSIIYDSCLKRWPITTKSWGINLTRTDNLPITYIKTLVFPAIAICTAWPMKINWDWIFLSEILRPCRFKGGTATAQKKGGSRPIRHLSACSSTTWWLSTSTEWPSTRKLMRNPDLLCWLSWLSSSITPTNPLMWGWKEPWEFPKRTTTKYLWAKSTQLLI